MKTVSCGKSAPAMRTPVGSDAGVSANVPHDSVGVDRLVRAIVAEVQRDPRSLVAVPEPDARSVTPQAYRLP
jgi:hypothetical protein